MKELCGLLLCISVGLIKAQELPNLSLIEQSITTDNIKESEHHIRIPQFFDTCIYDQRCGVFLSKSFKRFGLIKGTFLSIDRRLRCNGLTKSQTFPVRFNSEGLIKDYAEDYSFKSL